MWPHIKSHKSIYSTHYILALILREIAYTVRNHIPRTYFNDSWMFLSVRKNNYGEQKPYYIDCVFICHIIFSLLLSSFIIQQILDSLNKLSLNCLTMYGNDLKICFRLCEFRILQICKNTVFHSPKRQNKKL